MLKRSFPKSNFLSLALVILICVPLFAGLLRTGNNSYSSARTRPQPHQLTEPEKLDAAQRVLIKYFSELHDGNYEKAAEHFSGSYLVLEVLNPDDSATDHATLLEDACEINAFTCLEIKDIISAQKVSLDEYQFEVTFQEADGTKYQQQTRDGASVSVFSFIVLERDGEFFVNQLPVHS